MPKGSRQLSKNVLSVITRTWRWSLRAPQPSDARTVRHDTRSNGNREDHYHACEGELAGFSYKQP